jgi:hypothetical protein
MRSNLVVENASNARAHRAFPISGLAWCCSSLTGFVTPCLLTFLALQCGLIPAEKSFSARNFQRSTRCTVSMSRACSRASKNAPTGVAKTRLDRRGVYWEWRLSLVLVVVIVTTLKRPKRA